MAGSERWYFTREQLQNSPSRKCGIDAEKELSYRQQAANFIQDMGQRLQVTQLCINTAIVYMHRFYVFHSFSKFHRNAIAACAIFLAAKVEEQPRKLEHVIKVAHYCLNVRPNKIPPSLNNQSPEFIRQANELIVNENIMLQTLGFDIAIEHPHTAVVNCCQLVRAQKELAQTSYFMATNSLHLTTMCLQYKPSVVACVCIHLACKWSSYEIPISSEGNTWFSYVDSGVTLATLESLTEEFLLILNKCPSRLKKKGESAARPSGLQTDTRHLSSTRPQNPAQSSSAPSSNTSSAVGQFAGHSSSGSAVAGLSTASASVSSSAASAQAFSRSSSSKSVPPSKLMRKEPPAAQPAASNQNSKTGQPEKKELSASSTTTTYFAQKESKKDALDRKQHSLYSSQQQQQQSHSHPQQTSSSDRDSSSATNDTQNNNKPAAENKNLTKQQQVSNEKQRLSDERNKIKNANSLSKYSNASWSEAPKQIAQPAGSSFANKNGMHSAISSSSSFNSGFSSQAFYDNSVAESMYSNSNSNSSGESGFSLKHYKALAEKDETASDSKKPSSGTTTNPHELKMEFSDNDESNQSPAMNLSSISNLINVSGSQPSTAGAGQQPTQLLPSIQPTSHSSILSADTNAALTQHSAMQLPLLKNQPLPPPLALDLPPLPKLADAAQFASKQTLPTPAGLLNHPTQQQQMPLHSHLSSLNTNNLLNTSNMVVANSSSLLQASSMFGQLAGFDPASANTLPIGAQSTQPISAIIGSMYQQQHQQQQLQQTEDLASEKLKSKSKDKDRSEKKHKDKKHKNKSKEKHKDKERDKDKEKDYKYSIAKTGDADAIPTIPLKLKIKTSVALDETGESPADQKQPLKVIISKSSLGGASSADRKRRVSPKDAHHGFSKMSKND